jgi:hypothetical protein
MLKILVDRNIEREAITHRTVMREKALKWGSNEITSHVMDRERFAPRAAEHFRNEQLPYLATIGNLARQGSLALSNLFAPGWADTPSRELDASVGASGPHDFAVRDQHLSSACR